MQILVVDDEEVLRELVADVLQDVGYEAVTASDGSQALAMLNGINEPPSLIIADIMMPGVDGIELTERVKTDPDLQGVPVVLMSAAPPPRGGHMAEEFIRKPFEIDDLLAVVGRCISHGQ